MVKDTLRDLVHTVEENGIVDCPPTLLTVPIAVEIGVRIM
jgi:hypothetical protein